MKKTFLLSILVVALQFAAGVKAQAQQPARIPRIGILIAASASFYFGPGRSISPTAARAWAMSKEKTLSLSTDMQKGNSNGCLTLQPSWSVSKLTSSSPPQPGCFSCQEGERDYSHRIRRIAAIQ